MENLGRLDQSGEEGKGEPLPAVGGPAGLRSIEQAAREYVEAARDRIRARSRPISYEVDAATEAAEDAAWTNLCVAVDGWTPDARGSEARSAPPSSAGPSPDLKSILETADLEMPKDLRYWYTLRRNLWALATAPQGVEARPMKGAGTGMPPEVAEAGAELEGWDSTGLMPSAEEFSRMSAVLYHWDRYKTLDTEAPACQEAVNHFHEMEEAWRELKGMVRK